MTVADMREMREPKGMNVPGGDKFIPVGEDGLTRGTGEEACSSHVLDENPTHFLFSCRFGHTFLGIGGKLANGQLLCKERGVLTNIFTTAEKKYLSVCICFPRCGQTHNGILCSKKTRSVTLHYN